MCCFSQPVMSVSATNIFARPGDDSWQFIVYSMSIESKNELAMILPLPVKTPAKEEDFRFINLKDYSNFFSDLLAGFPVKPSRSLESAASDRPVPLIVHEVGDFQASFVPTMKDFSRLDPRFQLPKDAWDKLPVYESYGFAVFKLKPGAHKIHPMAFSFPRRNSRSLFFPTVHIHDGKVHSKAHFDHVLYCQPSETQRPSFMNWKESYTHAKNFVDPAKSSGIVDGDQHCYKKELKGNLLNQDTLLDIA